MTPRSTTRPSTRTGKKARGRSRRGSTQADAGPPTGSSPAIPFEVAVCESTKTAQERARAILVELGYTVAAETDRASIQARLLSGAPRAVLVGLPEGAPLVADCLAIATARPIVIAAMPGPATTGRARAAQVGSDLFTLRPHSRDSLATAMSAAEQLALLRDRVTSLRGSEELLRERLKRYGQSDLATGFFHIEFFEHVLVMELKRARRYGYSLAAVLVALDAWRGPDRPPPAAGRRLRSAVASTIVDIVRDIDLPVDLAEDRILLFLPYTDIDGATRVGRRIADAVSSCASVTDGDRNWKPFVSIGIAALKPGKPISFARLMRDAGAALRAAQLKGGDRVVVRT